MGVYIREIGGSLGEGPGIAVGVRVRGRGRGRGRGPGRVRLRLACVVSKVDVAMGFLRPSLLAHGEKAVAGC